MFRIILFVTSILFNKIVYSDSISEYYDAVKGTPLTKEQFDYFENAKITELCAIRIKSCDENEGRRIDDSCNNLHNVSRGTRNNLLLRLLPSFFHNASEPRLSQNGGVLPLCRRLRTDLLLVGHVHSQIFTQLVPYFFDFITADMTSLDNVDEVLNETDCCQSRTDRNCIPMTIPDDDPVHRFSTLRCMNQTRPKSFQSQGCLGKDTTPETIQLTTSHIDLSVVYGNSYHSLMEKGRKFEGGLLKYETDGGKFWPPSHPNPYSRCILNEQPLETRCHDTPDNVSNTALGVNLMMIWFWRNHNKIAGELAKMNRCWNDDLIFETARDINIAAISQIFFYEMLPNFMGNDNLIKDEVISFGRGHRDIYDEKVNPQTTVEFKYIMNWLHILQSGTVKMNSAKRKVQEVPIGNLTLRTGYIANNIKSITKGSYSQPCSRRGRIVHPNMAELAYGPLQKMYDVFAADLCKGRYLGLASYIQYRKFCSRQNYTRFEDLNDVMDDENIDLLKLSYKDVNDIDLMAGVWLERSIEGGHVPPTFYCLAVDQLKRNIKTDRHWYERANRPKAFNNRQLHEIRKASLAKLLCDVGDGVTDIQPDAFQRPGFGNRPKSCKNIDEINLRAWHDLNCSARKVTNTNSSNTA